MATSLSFPQAAEYVDAIYQEMRRMYPAIPPQINVIDEPAGDFGIAHWYEFDWRTSAESDFLMSFDNDRIPLRYTIVHELGHAISTNVNLKRGGDGFTNGLYDEFWKVRGFADAWLAPRTPWDAQLKGLAAERTKINSGYGYWPEENFADAFGAINSYGQGTLITNNYGAYLDEVKLRGFYASLIGEYMAVLTEEEKDDIARRVALRILPEVLGAIKGGFNDTLVAVADRIVAGDKKTGTAELDT